MVRYTTLLAALFVIPLFTTHEQMVQSVDRMVDAAAVDELCVLTGITQRDMPMPRQAMLKMASRVWLRPSGKERWEFSSPFSFSDAEQQHVHTLFEQLGFIAARLPQAMHYTHACVFGGIVPRMCTRMRYLIDLWNQGVRWNYTVLLAGDRRLDRVADASEYLCYDTVATEGEAMYALWQRLCDDGSVPLEMQALPVLHVVAMHSVDAAGNVQRPSTQDTLMRLIEVTKGEGGARAYLFVSSQPQIPYQERVVKHVFYDSGAVTDVVGPASTDALSANTIGILFDALARCLYLENQRWGIF